MWNGKIRKKNRFFALFRLQKKIGNFSEAFFYFIAKKQHLFLTTEMNDQVITAGFCCLLISTKTRAIGKINHLFTHFLTGLYH